MIEGASNRIPLSPHWEIYRQAEKEHLDLITSLSQEIKNYVMDKKEVNSTKAGRDILANWSRTHELNKLFDTESSQLFGMVLWVVLFDDENKWTIQKTQEGKGKLYRRVE